MFQATGRTIEFPGYLRAYVEGADDPDAELEDREAILPPLEEGATVACRELQPSGHTTQPPARYTEASLVKELEDRGIGRPSTYASVIDTILRRDYVFKKGSALVPTWTAFAKVQLLERYFAHLIDYEFTATMEEALDAIARGEGEAEKWLHSFYFGNGQVGFRDLVAEEHLAQIDKAEVNAVHIGVDGDGRELIVRVWPNGANIERGDEKGPVPADLAPDELTPEKADELLAVPTGPRELGTDPETGLTVLVLTGRFGPFVQLGEQEPGSKEKPKRASLFASMDPAAVTLEQAAGAPLAAACGRGRRRRQEITAQNGRYGPYLKKGTDSRSLGSEDELFSVTMEEAKAIFAQPKQRRGRGAAKPPLAELGAHPESGAPVRVLDGRFGPYITDGTINASVPRGTDPETVSLEQAVELLRERAARAPATKKAPAKRAAKKATKKASPPKSTTTRHGQEAGRQEGHRQEGPVHLHPFRDETSRSGYVDADDRRAAGSARGTIHPVRLVGAADAGGAVAGLRHQGVLPALVGAVRLQPRGLDRTHRHPRHRGAGVRQLGRRRQPGDDDPRAAGLPARHRRRRDHRPVRPAQGDGALRHRARQPPRDAARSSTTSPACC